MKPLCLIQSTDGQHRLASRMMHKLCDPTTTTRRATQLLAIFLGLAFKFLCLLFARLERALRPWRLLNSTLDGAGPGCRSLTSMHRAH